MQKTDFVKSVADRANVSQKEAKQVIDSALDIITESLKGGEKVTLTGFGTFEVRQRQEREGERGKRDSPCCDGGGHSPRTLGWPPTDPRPPKGGVWT